MARTLLGGILRARNKVPTPYVSRRTVSSAYATTGASLSTSGMEAQMRMQGENGTLYAITQRIAEAYAQVDWRLYRVPRDGRRRYDPGSTGVQDTRVEVTQHPALTLWNQPNPFFTGCAFRESAQQHGELAGEQYWITYRSAPGGLPLEMWFVRPDRMFPVVHPTEFLTGWIYRSPDGEEVPLDKDDVIFLRRPNPLDPYRGLSAVKSIMSDLDTARLSSEYARQFYYNSALPGGIILAEQNISEEDFDQLQARWAESHRGVAAAHRVAILESGMQWQSVSTTHEDMQLVELRESNRETIREAYGFPKAMTGATDDVNKANAYAGEVMFARWMTKPRLVRTREALNRRLLPMYGPSAANLEFDFVNPVPEDDEIASDVLRNKAEAASFLAGTGLWEAASIAEVCGLPSMEETGAMPGAGQTALPPRTTSPEPALPTPAKEDEG